MVAYTIKVEADLTGTTAVGSARTWTDMTALVLSTGIGEPIEIENWRPDESSDVSPSSLDLVINNSTGTYKPGATGIKPLSSYWRVSATISGVQTFLFDGVLTSASGAFVGGVKPVTKIHCVDILALFGQRTPLRSLYVEECLLDSPRAFYPLTEAEGATSAGDFTGNNIPAVVTNSKYGAGTLAFGAESDVVGLSGGVALASPDFNTAGGTARGTYLKLPSTVLPDVPGWTMEIWAAPSTVVPTVTNPSIMSQQGATGWFMAGFFTGSVTGGLGGIVLGSPTSPGAISEASPTSNCDGLWHHLAASLSSDGRTFTAYVDGVSVGSTTLASTTGWVNPATPVLLGFWIRDGLYEAPYNGSIAGFATYSTVLSAARVLAHYNAGKKAFCGESTDTHIARLLSYRANFGSSLDAGVGAVGAQDTDGVTLAEALLATARAEVGVVYVNGSAQVAFRNRSRLFNPATALTLNATNAGEVTPDVEPRIDDQGMVNDATISRPRGADQRVFNQTSINLYGTNDGSGERIVNTDQAALDIANDLVAQNKTPLVDTPSITCDINAMSTVATAQSVLARAPLDRVTVTNLPSTAPTIDGYVQGRHVTIGADKTFTVTFHLSPLRLPVMVADDATLGICDTVNVAAF